MIPFKSVEGLQKRKPLYSWDKTFKGPLYGKGDGQGTGSFKIEWQVLQKMFIQIFHTYTEEELLKEYGRIGIDYSKYGTDMRSPDHI